ncbi:hypothetical protein GALMADRAFT_227940 [Galerina marginata CBS 339.88]|uniref:Mid2 domain-containing protein n=1 Tax=Galerina marginata (strain CBS 339.88) TaxID=685588 RepID=A0A067SRE4_GALM3|nr:hypothetical protein GALMADRAFT_227940 [Galerina marginata CBS 339.88]
MLWFLLSLLTLSLNLQGILAQSDASCLPFYNWTSNSHKQTPCDVASSLLAICNNGPFPVDALPESTHYLGPSLQNANPCQCSTVTYSLMSACGACQGRTYLSWSVWSANCPTVSLSSFPELIPTGVAVPGWAYLDVKANDNFDQSLAKQDANLTESTAIPSPTSSVVKSTAAKSSSSTVVKSTSGFTTATATTSILPSPSASSAGDSSSSASRIKKENAIGGGIVGGLVGLMVICGLFFWYIQRRRRFARDGQPLPSLNATDPEIASWHGQGPYMRQAGGSVPQISAAPSLNSSLQPAPANYTFHSAASGSADSVPAGHATS